VLAAAHVLVAGEVDELLATHWRLTGPPCDPARMPSAHEVIDVRHAGRQSTMVVRTPRPIADPAWAVEAVGLEDIVLAYTGARAGAPPAGARGLELLER